MALSQLTVFSLAALVVLTAPCVLAQPPSNSAASSWDLLLERLNITVQYDTAQAQRPTQAPAGIAAGPPNNNNNSNNNNRKKLTKCPPSGFSPISNFNVNTFLEGPTYYVHQQMVIPAYEPLSQLNCVQLTYTPVNASNVVGQGLNITRFARDGSIIGAIVTTPYTKLKVKFTDRRNLSKMQLFLQNQGSAKFSPSSYWVIAAAADYSWVIISAGAPKVLTVEPTTAQNACRTGDRSGNKEAKQTNDIGLWLMTRSPVRDVAAESAMRAVLTEKSMAANVVQVQHDGCVYA